jgi:Aspartyl protease
MAITTINFSRQYLCGSSANNLSNRPYAWIDVHGPSGGVVSLWAIMDSGADYLQVPRSVAMSLGISLAGPSTLTVHSASGSTSTLPLVSGVEVSIEGVRVTVDALFGPPNVELVGRTAIVAAIEFGLNSAGWLAN